MLNSRQVITAVDIGTSKLCVLIGECDSKGRLRALAMGERDSGDAVCKGEIRKMSDLCTRLSEALEDASDSAGTEIDPANMFFSVTGRQIASQRSIGSVTIMNEARKVCEEEIKEALENSRQISLPVNTVPINFVDSEFIMDGNRKVEDPLGLVGSKLEAVSFCVHGSSSMVENYRAAIGECGYQIKHKGDIFAALASAKSTLGAEDLKHGTLLIDIGAGTSDFALFHGNGYFDCGSIPVGCDHIANDMCAAFDIHVTKAREIIQEHLQTDDFLKEQFVSLDRSGEPRRIPSVSIEKVVGLRVNEIFEIIAASLQKSRLKQHLGRGVVVCGGGAKIAMIVKGAEKFFEATVRTGEVREIDGELSKLRDPRYCCVAGILKYGAEGRSGGSDRMRIISGVDKGLWSLITQSWGKIVESIKI